MGIKKPLILIVALLMLGGCSDVTQKETVLSSSQGEEPLLSWDDRVLTALPWEEWGLQITPPDEALVALYAEWDNIDWYVCNNMDMGYSLKGRASNLEFAVPPSQATALAVDTVYILCLQAFPLKDLETADRYIKIGERLVDYQEAEEWMVYCNEEVAVFELFEAAEGRSFEEWIEAREFLDEKQKQLFLEARADFFDDPAAWIGLDQ